MSQDDEEHGYPRDLAFPGPASLRSFLDDLLLGWERPLFDLESMTLRPLCRVETAQGGVTVTFDLPYVEKKDITLTSTDNTVEIEAKMRKPVTIRVGGSVQRRMLFQRYTTRVSLPASVTPEKAKATFRNGLLTVKFPAAKRGNKVKIV